METSVKTAGLSVMHLQNNSRSYRHANMFGAYLPYIANQNLLKLL
jgi:hypothetical protein